MSTPAASMTWLWPWTRWRETPWEAPGLARNIALSLPDKQEPFAASVIRAPRARLIRAVFAFLVQLTHRTPLLREPADTHYRLLNKVHPPLSLHALSSYAEEATMSRDQCLVTAVLGVAAAVIFACLGGCILLWVASRLPPTDTSVPVEAIGTPTPSPRPAPTSTPPTSAPTPRPPSPARQASPTPIQQLRGVYIGMPADDVLKVWGKGVRTEVLGTNSEGLIVAWVYQDARLTMKRSWLGGTYQYRVAEIRLR